MDLRNFSFHRLIYRVTTFAEMRSRRRTNQSIQVAVEPVPYINVPWPQLDDFGRSSDHAMNADTLGQRQPKRFSISVLLTLTSFIAIILAGWRTFGMRGIAPSCAVVAIAWFVLSRTKTPSFYPFNRNRMTIVELLTILSICVILYGLTLPAVQSGPHKRRMIPGAFIPTNTVEIADPRQ